MGMKALYFTKIDYIRSRTQLYLILVMLAVVTMIMKFMTDGTDMMVFLYGIFIIIIFSTVPFGNCSRKDAGFLQVLPATVWQRVLGRFLFGFSLLIIGSLVSAGCMVVYWLYAGVEEKGVTPPLCMIFAAIGLVIITVQYIVLYLVGESSGAQALNLVRMIPGMSFFFGSVKLMGEVSRNPEDVRKLSELVSDRLHVISLCSIAAALAVMAAGVVLCVKVIEKKDC